jgi:membrane protein implicated in regulation of membrane protease activity
MPEWFLLIAALAAFCALGPLWRPLLWALPLLALAIAMPLAQSWLAARRAVYETQPRSALESLKRKGMTAFLHLVQPLARLYGRIEFGLTLWRAPITWRLWKARPRAYSIWNERWRSPTDLLEMVEKNVRDCGPAVLRGGEYDTWDLEARAGALGFARLRVLVEEHGAGKQLARFRLQPRCSIGAVLAILALTVPAIAAVLNGAWVAAAVLGAFAAAVLVRTVQESAGAMLQIERALGELREVLDRQR